MPVLVARGLAAVVAAVLMFNTMALGIQADIISYQMMNDSIIYRMEVKDGEKKIPAKIEYKGKNKVEFSYKKNGKDIEIGYKREGIPPTEWEKAAFESMKKEALRHSKGWLKSSTGRAKDLLVDFRNSVMRVR